MSKEPEQRALTGSARLSGSTTVAIFSATVPHTFPTLYIHKCDHETISMCVVAGSPHWQPLAYAVVMHVDPRDYTGRLKVGQAPLTFCLLDPAFFDGTPMTETSRQVLDTIRCARNSFGGWREGCSTTFGTQKRYRPPTPLKEISAVASRPPPVADTARYWLGIRVFLVRWRSRRRLVWPQTNSRRHKQRNQCRTTTTLTPCAVRLDRTLLGESVLPCHLSLFFTHARCTMCCSHLFQLARSLRKPTKLRCISPSWAASGLYLVLPIFVEKLRGCGQGWVL